MIVKTSLFLLKASFIEKMKKNTLHFISSPNHIKNTYS